MGIAEEKRMEKNFFFLLLPFFFRAQSTIFVYRTLRVKTAKKEKNSNRAGKTGTHRFSWIKSDGSDEMKREGSKCVIDVKSEK